VAPRQRTPVLIPHGFEAIDTNARFLDFLGRHAEI
jgi:hypothetical protein